jgi:hypothetical protein
MKMLALLASLILATTLHLHAEGGAVRLNVVQNVKTKGGGRGTTTQIRQLVITLNNTSNAAMDSLKVKYWFFTRDAKGGGNLSVHKSGEATVSLAPVGKQVLISENITSTYTVAHNEISNNNQVRGANGQQYNVPNVTRVEASGQRIVAHAVRVFDGEKLVGEYYSEYSLRQKMGVPPPEKPPEK